MATSKKSAIEEVEVVAATKYTPAISEAKVVDAPESLQENAIESREQLIKELSEIMDDEALLDLLNREREKHKQKPKSEPEPMNIDPEAEDLNAVDIEEFSVEAEDAKEEAEEKKEAAREQAVNQAELDAEFEKSQQELLQQRAEFYANEKSQSDEEENDNQQNEEEVFAPKVVVLSPRDELLLLLKEGLDQHGIEYNDRINELDHRELRKLADELQKYNTERDYKGLLEFSKKNELSFSEPKKKNEQSNNYDFASLNAKINTAVQGLERSTEKELVASVEKALDAHGIKYNKEKINNLDHKALRELAGELKKSNTPNPDYSALMKFGKQNGLEFDRDIAKENNQLKDNDFINALNLEMDKAVKNVELLYTDEPQPVLQQSAQPAPVPAPSMRPKQAKNESVPEEKIAVSPEKEQFNAALKEMMEKFYQSVARSQAENALSPSSDAAGVNAEGIVQSAGDKGMAEGKDKAARIAIPSGPFSNPPSASSGPSQDSIPSPNSL